MHFYSFQCRKLICDTINCGKSMDTDVMNKTCQSRYHCMMVHHGYLQSGEHDSVLSMLDARVHQVFDQVDF